MRLAITIGVDEPRPAHAGAMTMSFRPYRLAGLLVGATVLLGVASLAWESVDVWLPGWMPETSHKLLEKFDLDRENAVPPWFSSSLLLLCSLLLAWIAVMRRRLEERFTIHWGVLAAIFLLLSLDETASFHELLIDPVRNHLDLEGYLSFAWVVPAAGFVAALACAYLRWFLSLPRKSRALFLVAAVTFLGGAMGMEMVGAKISWDAATLDTLAYKLVMTGEELLEMSGVVLFLYGLLDYVNTSATAAAAAAWRDRRYPGSSLRVLTARPLTRLDGEVRSIDEAREGLSRELEREKRGAA